MAMQELSPPRVEDLLRASREAGVQELCLPHALGPESLIQLNGKATSVRQLKRGESLFRQGYGLHALYMVTDGLLKTLISDGKGREQITGFHFPSELVGLDAYHNRQHVCMAVAVVPSIVRIIPLHHLVEAMAEAPVLHEALERLISRTLAGYEQLLMVINQRTSIERVSIFLFSLACRLGHNGRAATSFPLLMSRADIANYLGLATETVSRAISRLHEEGVVKGAGKQIRIINPERLGQLAFMG